MHIIVINVSVHFNKIYAYQGEIYNISRISYTLLCFTLFHYNDVIMGAMASQITSLTMAYSTVYSGADQRKHQSTASLAFVRGIHRWPVNSPHKWPVTRKMFLFDDITSLLCWRYWPLMIVIYWPILVRWIWLLQWQWCYRRIWLTSASIKPQQNKLKHEPGAWSLDVLGWRIGSSYRNSLQQHHTSI